MTTAPAPGRPRVRHGREPRHRDPEVWWWVFVRVSGVLLVVLAAGYFLDRHLVHDRSDIDFEFMAGRWRNPFWRVWDTALVVLAAAHGGRGLRNVADDLVASPSRRAALKLAVAVGTALVALVGLVAVVGFSPAP